MSEVRLAVEQRTEFGKGAARRARRAGKIPAVLYGHGEDPRHLSLPAVDFARVLRENGNNAVLTLNIGGTRELALTKTITVHPLKNYIEHVDLLVVKRGEKVTVDVPIVVSGEPETGAIYYQEVDTISVEAEALHIPEQFEISVDGAEIGTQINAADVSLPANVTLAADPEMLVVNVAAMPAGEEEETSEEEAGEEGGEAAASEESGDEGSAEG